MHGFTSAEIAFSISPARISSGMKYSPCSNRLPTSSIAARQSARISVGGVPASSNSLVSASAWSSSISAIALTSFSDMSFLLWMV